ncbi:MULTISPECIES: hypothetical protein [Pantoea]|uniref:Uncharacterized protein n=1 Tax=Pantoea dispersa TaxID=59814 RepID=A0ABY3A1I1_9GAMM|nr:MULTISPECIES: hypothetical protein [Pantoea]KAA6100201.1 hypothetical protein F3I21_11940 [Pantoea sp. B_9]KAA6116995.1 hypothetical protein F3I18_00670 [Pantoea sp. B_10]TQC75922.1 hypothetical protein FK492_08525 [Pantoea dispersa]
MNKKPTFYLLILSMLYGVICFFCLGIVLRLIVNYLHTGNLQIGLDAIYKTIVMSGIAGVAAGFGSWIFARIDEHKTRKSPPSDPKP